MKSELERKQKNLEMGILDDDDIIQKKKEKDMKLKSKFSIESFELKYEREIKQLFDKQRKREQEKL